MTRARKDRAARMKLHTLNASPESMGSSAQGGQAHYQEHGRWRVGSRGAVIDGYVRKRATIRIGGRSKIAMLERTVAALKSNESAALREMNDKNNKQFHDRDLYVFCITMADGNLTTTANPKLIGTDLRASKAGDDPFGQRVYDVMTSTAPGNIATIGYKFPKPGTTEYVPKESFVTRVGDQGCGVGYCK
jgi:hypothetical protein